MTGSGEKMKERAYHEKVNIENEKKLRALMAELPRFCREFFIGIEPTTSSRTRIAYAYDLGVFFNYLHCIQPQIIFRRVFFNVARFDN